MALIVQKFGGTSISSVDRIRSVATRVLNEIEQGNQVVVVVSAMAGVTNQLVGWAHQCAHQNLSAPDYDVVISSGEQVTCGLMALALNDMGIKARSWLGWQLPLQTNDHYKNATIHGLKTEALFSSLARGEVAVVAGFQGVSPEHRLTTLGRGGSDYTAVALAINLKADRCDIYTDVDGIYSADPRLVTNACHLKTIAHQDMLDFASFGAKIIQPQALEVSQGHDLPIRVLSSFNHQPGSLIDYDLDPTGRLLGVASRRDRALFNLSLGTRCLPLLKQRLFDHFIEVDETCVAKDDDLTVPLMVAKDDFEEASSLIQEFYREYPDAFCRIEKFPTIGKVTIVGNVAKRAETLLNSVKVLCEDKEIEPYHVQMSRRALSLLVAPDQYQETVKELHNAFVLKKLKDVA